MFVDDRDLTRDVRRIAALAALGMAATPLVIALPLLGAAAIGVQRPTGDVESQVAAVLAHPVLYGGTGLVFLILGPSLVVLALALHDLLWPMAPLAVRIGTAAGVIGGALITVVGFGPPSLAVALPTIESQDHQAAIAVYLANTHAPNRLAWGGMAMFGVFALVVSIVGARAALLPKGLSYLGILLALLLMTGNLLPGPLPLAAIPIIVIWSIWLAVVLLRRRSLEPSSSVPEA